MKWLGTAVAGSLMGIALLVVLKKTGVAAKLGL